MKKPAKKAAKAERYVIVWDSGKVTTDQNGRGMSLAAARRFLRLDAPISWGAGGVWISRLVPVEDDK